MCLWLTRRYGSRIDSSDYKMFHVVVLWLVGWLFIVFSLLVKLYYPIGYMMVNK